tara:strand:+ start:320 stop:673 length:354 start_codon:yes stop_codon:yes gene_type:complete
MTAHPAILPPYVTPQEIAAHFGVGERWVREKAMEIGACCIIAKKMVHLPHHVEAMMEALEWPSNSTSAGKSSTSEAALPGGNSDALRERLIAKKRSGSKRRSSKALGSVVSMGQARG